MKLQGYRMYGKKQEDENGISPKRKAPTFQNFSMEKMVKNVERLTWNEIPPLMREAKRMMRRRERAPKQDMSF